MFRWPFKGPNTPTSPMSGPGDSHQRGNPFLRCLCYRQHRFPPNRRKTLARCCAGAPGLNFTSGPGAGAAAIVVRFGAMNQFNFGGSPATGGGFTFGTAKTTTTTPGPGFSFSTPGSGGGFNFGTPSQPTASTPSTNMFSLTTPASSTPGFSFGSQVTTAPGSATSGFSLGLSTPKLNLGSSGTPFSSGFTGGFGLGNNTFTNSVASNVSSQASTPTGFIFGPPTTTAAQPTSSIGFSFPSGNVSQMGTTGFNLGSMGNASQPTALTGLTFAAATPAPTAVTSTQPYTAFNLGGQPTGLGFGLLASTASTTIPTSTLASSFNQGPVFSFGSKFTAATSAPTSISGPTLFASIANSSFPVSSDPNLSVGTPSTSFGTPGLGVLGFGLKFPGLTGAATSTTTTTTSVPTSGFALNLRPPTAPSTGTIPSTCATLPSAITAPSTTPVMTYAQLESLINKWSLELEDQEKHFLQQATQVNAWDRTLIENGEKITSLHREVEKVKLDQKRLDQELDFILSQQKELEDLLVPLEEAVKEQSGTIYLQHADEEREKTYKLAENIDAQLKRMAQDLKEIIEHLNMAGGPPDTTDPIFHLHVFRIVFTAQFTLRHWRPVLTPSSVSHHADPALRRMNGNATSHSSLLLLVELQQICKILNAHMDSLQWIDQNSALLQRKVEEVSKVCESRRKEQERSYRIVFD
ncbi:nuclear pore glycoprotein p62 isoform X4 [Notamacropus eugenii]|uniref:nuclear pore glycoprotein p62 isoform X4 n=1 Tax=Notamacropus eugenii TaxID=9315 RepID=UPI003B683B56